MASFLTSVGDSLPPAVFLRGLPLILLAPHFTGEGNGLSVLGGTFHDTVVGLPCLMALAALINSLSTGWQTLHF